MASALPSQALEVSLTSDETPGVASPIDELVCECKCRQNEEDHRRRQLLCAVRPTETLPQAPEIFRCPRAKFQLRPPANSGQCSELNGIDCQGYSFYVSEGPDPITGKLENCSLKAVAGMTGDSTEEREIGLLSQ